MQRLLSLIGLFGLLAALVLAWLVHDAPIAPGLARGFVRVDGLSALFALATTALVCLRSDDAPDPTRALAATALLWTAYASTNLAAIAALYLGVAVLRARARLWTALLPVLCLDLGLALLGLRAGVWYYDLPGAGLGLGSPTFALLLLAALLGAGFAELPAGAKNKVTAFDPVLAVGLLYPLLRLFSLGPWNLGWLFATLLLGGAAAVWSAWRAAVDQPEQVAGWLGRYVLGLALAGAGLGSSAGLAGSGYALLTLPILLLGLPRSARSGQPWLLWLLSGAVPLSAPFVCAWIAVAAAVAGGVSMLAVVLWGAALLAAVAVARLVGNTPAEPMPTRRGELLAAAGLSVLLGVASPVALALLVQPMVDQLQGGLSPFGELALWPWAGLIAFDAARQPVATLPSLALGALMLILAALAWLGVRLLAIWHRPNGE